MPTPRRQLTLPPEIVSHALSSLAETLPDDREGWRIRNAALAAAALVSNARSEAAYRELYGDLRLLWVGRRR